MRQWHCALAALSLAAFGAAQAPKLGEPAPELGPANVSLKDFRGKQNVLLILEREKCPPRSPQVVRDATDRLAAMETALVVARDASADYAGNCAAFLIDKDGALRRTGQPGPEAKDLVGFVELWRVGKLNFDLSCARCHGSDGRLDEYPGIKTLGGIGNRMAQPEIRSQVYPVELTRDQITVRSHIFTRRELDALIVYVAGL